MARAQDLHAQTDKKLTKDTMTAAQQISQEYKITMIEKEENNETKAKGLHTYAH